VLRGIGVGPSTKVSRRAGLAGIVITLVCAAAAPAALADRRPQPNADELWRAYPLEQTPAKTAPAPAARAPRGAHRPAADRGSSSGAPWGLLVAIGAASALLVGLAAVRLRRRPAPAHASGGAAVVAPPAPPPSAPPEKAGVAPTQVELNPLAPPGAARPGRAAAAVAANADGRPVPTRKGPVCQIRWSRRARRFYAFTVDENGSEQQLARSPVVDWDQPGPPEETPEARAAIRRLTKSLRDGGWRLLRARGVDFHERQWYARRFRWPTEAEAQPGGPDGAARDHEVGARPGGAR
jgi:hypothetical protein